MRLKHPSVLPTHAILHRTQGGIELRAMGDGASLRNRDGIISGVFLENGMRLMIGAVPVQVTLLSASAPPAVPPAARATVPRAEQVVHGVQEAPASRSAHASEGSGPSDDAAPSRSSKAKFIGWIVAGLLLAVVVVKLGAGASKLDMHSIGNEVWFALATVVGIFGVIIMIAGAAKRVVIYYSGWDLMNSVGAVLLPIVSFGLFGSEHFALKWILAPLALLCGLACLVANYVLAAKHNRSALVGAVIGTFKPVFGTLVVLLLYGQYQRLTSKNTTTGEKIHAVVVAAVIVAITAALINGPEVHEAKGWTASDEGTE